MDTELIRMVGAGLVIIGAVLKLVLKTKRPPIGQIIMSCIWIGLTLLVASFVL